MIERDEDIASFHFPRGALYKVTNSDLLARKPETALDESMNDDGKDA